MNRKFVKSEIGALEYAVCELMAILDRLLSRKIKKWQIGRGLDLNISMADGIIEPAFVNIHPVGWPKDAYIFCKFYQMRGTGGWIPEDVSIFNQQLFVPSLSFKFNGSVQPFIVVSATDRERELMS